MSELLFLAQNTWEALAGPAVTATLAAGIIAWLVRREAALQQKLDDLQENYRNFLKDGLSQVEDK